MKFYTYFVSGSNYLHFFLIFDKYLGVQVINKLKRSKFCFETILLSRQFEGQGLIRNLRGFCNAKDMEHPDENVKNVYILLRKVPNASRYCILQFKKNYF